MRIAVLDTYYKAFRDSFPINSAGSYEGELRRILDRSFATSDFYSRNLLTAGWTVIDIIADWPELQQMWARENGRPFSLTEIAIDQIETFEPSVVFVQDLSFFDAATLSMLGGKYCLAGQISCPWPGDDIVRQFDILYTSFPHYVPRIEALGVRAIYNPLAFEPEIITRLKPGNNPERIHDVVFIGGVGNPSHWRYGMEVLETVAREIPTFKWWGYGVSALPADSILRQKYQGEAWGLDMYEILLRSKICLNRHGEVAEGYANNMRMFEATGCGAMLLTDGLRNLGDFFTDIECVDYGSPQGAVDSIRYWLNEDPEGREGIAADGQARTLRDHTYAQRMKVVSETLKEMLVTA